MQSGYQEHEARLASFRDEMIDLQLLLPRRRLEALEEAAFRRGLSTGELIRRVVSAFLARESAEHGEA